MGRLSLVPGGDSLLLPSEKTVEIKTCCKHEEYKNMINPIKQKTVAAAIGSLLIGSVSGISTASAASPFAMTSMESGYVVADKMGEGKCGGDKAKEGKCGGDKTKSKAKEGQCGEGMENGKAMKEGKCGGDKAKAKAKTKEEGKCGEGKCGGSGM